MRRLLHARAARTRAADLFSQIYALARRRAIAAMQTSACKPRRYIHASALILLKAQARQAL
ncbi:MAG: hypothetical protein B7Y01_00150 [Xanthobacter sp. 17-67-6]|nr:MAG: hypothetical protein B7Y01_00150 [Xanthobacter sp. 17-67-6]